MKRNIKDLAIALVNRREGATELSTLIDAANGDSVFLRAKTSRKIDEKNKWQELNKLSH